MRGKVRCGPESRPAASLKRRGFRRETVSGSAGGFLEARRETHGPGRHEARALARGSGFKGGLRGSGRRRPPDCRRHAGRKWSGLGDECTGRDRQVPLHCGAGEPRRRSLSCGGRCRSGWPSGLGRIEAGRGIWNSRRSLPPPTRVKPCSWQAPDPGSRGPSPSRRAQDRLPNHARPVFSRLSPLRPSGRKGFCRYSLGTAAPVPFPGALTVAIEVHGGSLPWGAVGRGWA